MKVLRDKLQKYVAHCNVSRNVAKKSARLRLLQLATHFVVTSCSDGLSRAVSLTLSLATCYASVFSLLRDRIRSYVIAIGGEAQTRSRIVT